MPIPVTEAARPHVLCGSNPAESGGGRPSRRLRLRRQRHRDASAATPHSRSSKRPSVLASASPIRSIPTLSSAPATAFTSPLSASEASPRTTARASSPATPTRRPASLQTPVVVLSQITAYPGKLPPFIDPTVMNGQGNALFLESKVDRPGTIQNWTLDVQRQLPFQTIVDVAYVGAHGDHLQAFLHDPNQGNPVQHGARRMFASQHRRPGGKPSLCGPEPWSQRPMPASAAPSLRPCVPSRSMEPSRWIQRPWTIPSAITPTTPCRLR